MATLSQFNNTNVPLLVGQTFTGAWERSLRNLELTCFINCSGYSLLTIEQSADGSNVRIPTSFNYTPTTEVSTFSVSIGLPFFRVKLLNEDVGTQAYLSLNSYLIATPPQQVQASISGVVDVSGNVVATNLITETLATRRVDFLVVGDWYRVASVGLTSGAEWNQIGAIVDGESVPVIGRLFKCLAVGPAVAGGGECYDVEYTEDVNATVTNLITETLATRRVDYLVVGNWYRVASVGITSGAQWNAIGAIVDGESEPSIGRLFKCLSIGPAVAGGGECYDMPYTTDVSATITNFPATQAVSGTVSLTDPTTVRVRDSYGDPIVTTAGNLMVGIGNIYTANPLHTIVDSGTIIIDDSILPLPVRQSPSNVLSTASVGTTSSVIKSGAGSIAGLYIQSDNSTPLAVNYLKIYDTNTAVAGDVPIMVIPVSAGSSQNINTYYLGISAAGCSMRATLLPTNGDNTAPSNTITVQAFTT